MNESDIKKLTGLSKNQVEELQNLYGYNDLSSAKKKHFSSIVFEVIKEPMFLLLVSCGTIYLLLGNFHEALLLLFFVFVIMGITIYQQNKTENALTALKDLTSPRALVIRNGQQIRIPGREVVTGDIIILNEGDRVPADGIIIWDRNLSIDESLLTGESAPVKKESTDTDSKMEIPGGENTSFIYSGTLVIHGQAIARVKTIGKDTEIGKIGRELQTIEEEDTLLQKETGKIVKRLTILSISLCLIVILTYGITRGDWLKGFLAGITLAMAILPEEIPVVLTIFFALGAWRMSKNSVLTRRANAVESLGAVTVLCVDKTGTLTQNKMSVKQLYTVKIQEKTDTSLKIGEYLRINENQKDELPENFHELVEYGILASKKDPFDPMEKELIQLGGKKLANTEHLHNSWELIKEYPLSKELLALSHVWKSDQKDTFIIGSKGAPEAIADLCHFNSKQLEELEEISESMSNEGLRLLGVASATFDKTNFPLQQHDFNFKFLGLIGFTDPIRPEVIEAVKQCYSAGIQLKMITGDHAGTAINIAREAGFKNPENTITGIEINNLKEEQLREKIKEINIFSRIIPEQKLRIVNAFKENNEITVMTGDGVNDAPALKSANIGIAMGGRGTDVARESADFILTDDNFSSIIQAIKMGRRVFENLRKAMVYILAIHVPIGGLSLLPVIFGWPLILFPAHIVFLQLIIDPSCSLVFEAEREEQNIMDHPPRKSGEKLLDTKTVLISLLQGLVLMFVCLFVFRYSINNGLTIEASRYLSFSTLISGNISLIFINRSWSQSIFQSIRHYNPVLWWITALAVVFLILVNNIDVLQSLFSFAPVSFNNFIIAVGLGLFGTLWFELMKPFLNKFSKKLYD